MSTISCSYLTLQVSGVEKLYLAAYDIPCHFVWKNYTMQRMISLVILSEKLHFAAYDIPCHFFNYRANK